MVETNIGGAINVVEAAQDARVDKVVFLSTDKAYQPVSPYGQSKALAESIFLASNDITGTTGPRFAITRYGNVWASPGSVVPAWRQMMEDGEQAVPITDPDCTRFFMTMDQAVDLVLDTLQTMKGGEIAIPILPAYRLGDLADAMRARTITIGLPKWEKKHESMNEFSCSKDARRMTMDELRDAIRNS
jgi:UDP-N-acetylglucosamine 4,6-dehydratase